MVLHFVAALVLTTAVTGSSNNGESADKTEMTAVSTTPAAADAPLAPLASAIANAPARETSMEPWMLDQTVSRPGTMKAMYGTLAALHAFDLYSTQRVLNSGGREVNPLMAKAASHPGGMIAVKALSTAASIYFAERAWKKNKKGAVVLMAVVNGVTAAVVANNMKNARR